MVIPLKVRSHGAAYGCGNGAAIPKIGFHCIKWTCPHFGAAVEQWCRKVLQASLNGFQTLFYVAVYAEAAVEKTLAAPLPYRVNKP